ncbi:T9SS type A sorting domain-containing protein [Flavobacterium lacus]|uniref:Putative secreted protein (Por secretion system target) n=1 Tax=Flavobacterium lacus TaxID=1353778 RepID=A0A328WTK0_9FLAO|nr:T9SS type A sorting domain-containing protein [Flavobacterium lacus]RAR47174.1 putative secreted protein (Por secretion system target) [Flavobacterium lacus]
MKKTTTLIRFTTATLSFQLFMLALCFTTNQANSQTLVANWERINLTPGTTTNVPNMIALTYGNGTFAAISYAGNQKKLFTSINGENWTESTFALPVPTAFPDDIVFMDDVFKLVTNGTVYTSTNLETWNFESIHSVFTARNLKKVNNLYFQGGEGRFATSTNGTTWTAPMNNGDYLDLAYGNNIYVLVGRQFAKGILYTSTDGVTWNNIIEVDDNFDMFYSVDFHDGTFILAGNNGIIGKSANGTEWTFSTPMGSPNSFFSIRYILNHWVVSASNKVYYSPDGETWTQATITGGSIGNLKRVEAYNGIGFIPGSTGRIIKTNEDALSINQPENTKDAISLYPNPASTHFTVNTNENLLAENAQLSLYNQLGQLVQQAVLNATQTNVAIDQLPSGIYHYQISNGDKLVKTGKVIKK